MNAIEMQAFMERAKAAAEARKNRPEEFYWPNIRKWLSTRKGDQPLPTCPVCREVLDVAGIDPVPTLDDDNNNTDTNNSSRPCAGNCESKGMAAVLPCGHMMCHYCTGRSDKLEFDENLPCPVCRARCRRSKPRADGCKHHIHYHVPTSRAKTYMSYEEMLAAVPLTIPEGGRMPKRCLACIACSALPGDTGAAGTFSTTSLYDKKSSDPLFGVVPWKRWTTSPPREEEDREHNVCFWRLTDRNGLFQKIKTTNNHCCYYERLANAIMQPRAPNLNADYEIKMRYDVEIGKYIIDFWFQNNVIFSKTFTHFLDLGKLVALRFLVDIAEGRLDRKRSEYLMMTAMQSPEVPDFILERKDLIPTMPLLWFSKGLLHYTEFPMSDQAEEEPELEDEDSDSEEDSEAEPEEEDIDLPWADMNFDLFIVAEDEQLLNELLRHDDQLE
ncbi:hypothetical protein V8F33_012435 [Rhypophila sp. PSN 637]